MEGLPLLETPRLVLRVPTVDDVEAMLAFVTRNREHLRASEPARAEAYFTREHWIAELSSLPARVLGEEVVSFVLVPRASPAGPVVGRCTLSGIARGPFQAAYLGYGLDRDQVGKGLMEEALRALIAFAFGPLRLHRLMANHVPRNERSARLLERLGFRREGLARDYLRLDGAWRDHVLTALVNEGWAPD